MVTVSWRRHCWYVPWPLWTGHPTHGSVGTCSDSWLNPVHMSSTPQTPNNSTVTTACLHTGLFQTPSNSNNSTLYMLTSSIMRVQFNAYFVRPERDAISRFSGFKNICSYNTRHNPQFTYHTHYECLSLLHNDDKSLKISNQTEALNYS